MAALDFPNAPTLGQQYPTPAVVGSPVYLWDGTKWVGAASLAAGYADYTPVGQCRLQLASSSSLVLMPYGGNKIRIAGALYSIPAGGVTISNASLAASTRYYVYAYASSGNVALEIVTTTHVTDSSPGNVGVEIKSGDNSRTLVGMIYTTAGVTFADAYAQRFVRSWFNSPGFIGYNANNTNYAYTVTSFTEIGAGAFRIEFLAWANEQFEFAAQMSANQTSPVQGNQINMCAGADGAPVGVASLAHYVAAYAGYLNLSILYATPSVFATEGYHHVEMMGSANTTATTNYLNKVMALTSSRA